MAKVNKALPNFSSPKFKPKASTIYLPVDQFFLNAILLHLHLR